MIRIVQATETHLDLLMPLFNDYRQFYGQESDIMGARIFLQRRIDKKESVIFLALEEDKGVGFTQLYPTYSSVSMQKFYILNDLFVSEEHRNKGIGERLLHQAKRFTADFKLKGLALETASDNPAQKLYERLGWIRDTDFYHYFWTNTGDKLD
ncbi:MAG: GNAT family N-acetyltransferase [Cyclobacteriaceae bacterium]